LRIVFTSCKVDDDINGMIVQFIYLYPIISGESMITYAFSGLRAKHVKDLVRVSSSFDNRVVPSGNRYLKEIYPCSSLIGRLYS
jgi:hypothetical protein